MIIIDDYVIKLDDAMIMEFFKSNFPSSTDSLGLDKIFKLISGCMELYETLEVVRMK